MHPDSARELKARSLEQLPSAPVVAAGAGTDAPWPWVAVGLTPGGPGSARVAVRLQRDGDRALLPDLGAAAAEVDVRVIGRVRAQSSPTPAQLQERVRPLRRLVAREVPDAPDQAGEAGEGDEEHRVRLKAAPQLSWHVPYDV